MEKLVVSTVMVDGVELATYDGERYFVKDIERRKQVGVYGTYTLDEWKTILSNLKERLAKSA